MFKGILFGVCHALALTLLFPVAVGLLCSPGGVAEQKWLDSAIHHLKCVRSICDDPDLQVRLDYAIERYNTVGRWDVAFIPLDWFGAAGMNTPTCPGISIDPSALDYGPEVGAELILHESLHDYFPYIGHSHVYPVIEKFNELSEKLDNLKL